MPAKSVICTFSDENSFTQILPEINTHTNARLIATSNIEVTYIDFPDQAKTAFEQAVLLWENYLISSQTIRIKATWTTTLTSSTLAVSGTTRIYKNFLNAPYSNVWYPTALAEALSGKDLNSGDYDINVSLNGNINWYYGIDAKAQAGKYDLITVTMHEIAHGLGISSSMEVVNSDTQGQYGQSGSAYVYDVFMQDTQKIKLTNTGVYGNPSQDLKKTLTSNALYFGLRNTKFSNALPRLYAPTTFKSGVSFSHFDETTYPSGNNNSLMSPNVRAAEVNQNPGELLLNCLNEMGWQINGLLGYVVTDTESIPEQNLEVKVFPNPVEDVLNVAFPPLNQPRKIKITLLNLNGQLIDSQLATSETYSMNVSNLPEGVYLLQILVGEKLTIKKIVK
ncbi:T9SS type A sorting domain-containing protein [Emticicia sp. SJ17W-69]|uniref:T9SS type A sorting domain-containing protein n=1 Tax=Emticicia sp. SJ17W-69 TaxID=3421657 RepID=UPI003EBF62E6